MKLFKNKRKENFERRIKAYFRNYFCPDPAEGISSTPRFVVPLGMLGITGFKFRIKKKGIIMEVTLEHPGRLIGPEGRTKDGVTEFIQRRVEIPFSITIKESNIWK